MRAVSLKALLLSTLILTSCGEQGFVPGNLSTRQGGAGSFTMPAKVDILLAQDDTPSMIQSLSAVSSQMPQFLSTLEAQGWDYRFVTTPLSTERPISEIMASKYDSNWFFNNSGQWLEPFPGADPNAAGMRVLPNLFRTPSTYNGFINSGNINYGMSQYEPGFQMIQRTINNYGISSQFHRHDALLAVIVLGNGEDGSGVNMCSVPGLAGLVPCELDPSCSVSPTAPGCENPPSATSSFNSYRNYFSGLPNAGVSAAVRFYSIVSYISSSQGACLQGNSTRGQRYRDMAAQLGGRSFDLCTTPVSQAINALAGELTTVRESFRTKYLVIGQEPNVGSIRITRFANGDPGQASEIPQDPVNGWTYVGGPQTVYTIDYPTPMNQQTGYIIELHGTAKLLGDDTADIVFTPAGGSASSG